MIFKKKGKGGLEALNSLVSTRLKEADASETEDDMSTEDASNEIVPLSPRAFSQTSSEDSASYRSIDRYGLYFAPSDISEGASEASSHNFWKKKLRDSFDEAENHSSDTIVKRVSFSDKPCILEFENDESAKLISTPEDFVVAKRHGKDADVSPKNAGNRPLAGTSSSSSLTNSLEMASVPSLADPLETASVRSIADSLEMASVLALADSLETLSVEEFLDSPTRVGKVTTTETSTEKIPVEESTFEHPDLTADKKDTDGGFTGKASSIANVAASNEKTPLPTDDAKDGIKLEVAQLKNEVKSDNALKHRVSMMKRDIESTKTKSTRGGGQSQERTKSARKRPPRRSHHGHRKLNQMPVPKEGRNEKVESSAKLRGSQSIVVQDGTDFCPVKNKERTLLSFLRLRENVKNKTASTTPKATATPNISTAPQVTNATEPSTTHGVTNTPGTKPVTEPNSDLFFDLRTAVAAVAAAAAVGIDDLLMLPFCSSKEEPSYECKMMPAEDLPVGDLLPTTTRSGKRRVRKDSTLPRNYSMNKEGKEESFLGGSDPRDRDQDADVLSRAETEESPFFGGSVSSNEKKQLSFLCSLPVEGPPPITKRSRKWRVGQNSIMPRNYRGMCKSIPMEDVPVEHPSPTSTRSGKRGVRQNSIMPRNHSMNEGGKEESFFGSSDPRDCDQDDEVLLRTKAEEPSIQSFLIDHQNQDHNSKVLPREERRRQKPKKGSRATGRKSWHQRLSLKQNKKEEKNEMVIPTMPAIEEEELLAVVEVENTMLPEVEKTILPETEVTTRGDDKSIDDYSYQCKMNVEEESCLPPLWPSLPPWWFWEFLCGKIKTKVTTSNDDKPLSSFRIWFTDSFFLNSVLCFENSIDDNSYQYKMKMAEEPSLPSFPVKMKMVDESSLPPWWSLQFLCGEFSVCSQTVMTGSTNETPANEYEGMSLNDDTTITSYTHPIVSASEKVT